MTWVYVAVAAGGLAALGTAIVIGWKWRGAKEAAAIGEAYEKNKRRAEETAHEIATKPSSELDAELAPWMRPDE